MKTILFFLSLILLVVSCSGPSPEFSAAYANGEENPTQIKFTNKTKSADSYTWYFGDGTISNQTNPVHEFKAFGDVMVVLEAKKGNSVSRDTQYVNIPEPPRTKVKIETRFGDMIAELFNTTPLHRENFIKLANEGYYDSLLFHRVMDGFMVQGGDPDSRDAEPGQQLGLGSPPYTIKAEIGAPHYRGALAAARKPDGMNPEYESSGSQFYIVDGKQYSPIELANVASQYQTVYNETHEEIYATRGGTPFLDNLYTVFGQVIEGMEVIDSITNVAVDGNNRPKEDIRMQISVINE
ncbi:peptidylprolyl isomerase [Portibacter marinus]|uniref:peptidylprolyl isomerase n=1 Tax=Portibacter marinus TaxID=2898660 RepID=UPI001F39B0DA|nr:peptidylprolyl isomerase [Portibacter marinus]